MKKIYIIQIISLIFLFSSTSILANSRMVTIAENISNLPDNLNYQGKYFKGIKYQFSIAYENCDEFNCPWHFSAPISQGTQQISYFYDPSTADSHYFKLTDGIQLTSANNQISSPENYVTYYLPAIFNVSASCAPIQCLNPFGYCGISSPLTPKSDSATLTFFVKYTGMSKDSGGYDVPIFDVNCVSSGFYPVS